MKPPLPSPGSVGEVLFSHTRGRVRPVSVRFSSPGTRTEWDLCALPLVGRLMDLSSDVVVSGQEKSFGQLSLPEGERGCECHMSEVTCCSRSTLLAVEVCPVNSGFPQE